MALQSSAILSKEFASLENRVAQGASRPKPTPLARLAAVVAWGPADREMPLVASTGRSVLDLPLSAGHTLLDELLDEVAGLGRRLGIAQIPTRLITNALGAKMLFGLANQHQGLSVEPHPLESRGTAGVLADLCKGYDADDFLLVLDGHQLLSEPLADLARELDSPSTSVSLFAHAEESPSAMMLIRCGCLRGISRLGRVEVHGQGLQQIAAGHRVEIVQRARTAGCFIRSLGLYIAALKRRHARIGAESDSHPAELQDFSIVEKGAEVGAGVKLHDSVVLKGGCVEAGAIIVRSVICPGGVVKRRRTCVDSMIIRGHRV